MTNEQNNNSSNGDGKVIIKEDRGLKPAQNPPPMPPVKDPKSEK